MNGIVRVAADGSISWHGDEGSALGPLVFDVEGLRFLVDGARGDRVVGLAAPDATALRAAGQWFTEPRVVEALAAAEDGAVLPGPVAGEALSRVATVEAVDNCCLGDLDEAVLAIDHGFAGQLVGDERRAYHGYSFAPSTVERLVDEIEIADYSGPLNQRVIEIVRAAPTEIFDDDERRSLVAGLQARALLADGAWEAFLAQTVASSAGLALSLGSAVELRVETADLRLLPPRLLAFDGPGEAEITVEELDGELRVSAELRPDVIRDSLEATGVFAVVADTRTGALLAHAPMAVVDDRLEAVVGIRGLDPATVRCGLVGADAELDALRLDLIGSAVRDIDRYCRHAWTEHRRAGAILAAVDATTDESGIAAAQAAATRARRSATRAMHTATVMSEDLAAEHREDASAPELAGYESAVRRLAEQIAEEPATDGPTGPTLAELHAICLG